MIYADFAYYSGTYKGTMLETDFNRISLQASAYLDSITFGRTGKSQSENIQAKIKDACCAVADILYKKDQGGEKTSETVGPWTKQFASSGKSLDQQQYDAALMYLGITGLMYRGVGC